MKKTFVWLLASLLFTMVGCVEGLHESGMTETSSEQLPDLTAGFAEGETRTYVESGKYLRWHEDDRLTAFYGNTLNRQYKFNGATGDNSGSFSYVSSGNLETGNALDRIYAVYPYDETATITDDGQISLTLPAVQTYAENSFGRGANTMLAVTENLEDTFLGFKNVCGYLKLKLYNADGATIKSIVVKGNGEEKIAGAATATVAFGEAPQLTMSDNATTTITLDCGDGVALGATAEAATEFWVVIPETTFESGITITVTDIEGGIFEKSTTKEVVIERNAVQPMATLGVEFVAPVVKPANNEIWYTSTDGKVVTPNRTNAFGANIVSNTYENGMGVIKFDAPVTSIGASAFSERSRLLSVTIPEIVTSIKGSAFANCTSLASVTIPESITLIESSAFLACHSLTNVTIPDSVTEIGNGAFSHCSSLANVTIGDSVTEIGNRAFSHCSSLANVTIPDSVTLIGEYAFSECSSLANVTIPDGVTLIGEYAFSECSSLANVIIGDSVTKIGAATFFYCTSLASVTIGDNVTSIGNSAFGGCTSLASVTIPDSVTTIGKFAFDGCSVLASATIGDSVTLIGEYAFSDCKGLASVAIGDSVTSIGINAFIDCSNLAEVQISDIAAWCKIKFDSGASNPLCYAHNLYLNNELVTDLVIPDSVTSIGLYAFYSCLSLSSVTIPDSVTEIAARAFQECSSLSSVYCKSTIPPTGGYLMFDNNASDRKIYVPTVSVDAYKSANRWSDYADAIVAYDFEDGEIASDRCKIFYTAAEKVEPYRTNVFGANINSNEWDSVTGRGVISFDGEVTTIGECAFYNCQNLASITIPNSVTSIAVSAFQFCSITSVTIPNSVTEIGRGAFLNCGLISVTIPDSVTSIGASAFNDCYGLTSVYCKAITPPSLNNYGFYDQTLDFKIYVPSASVDAYKSASSWSRYEYCIVGYDFVNDEIAPETPAAPTNNEIWYTATKMIEPYRTNAFGANITSNEWDSATGKGVITFDGEITTIGYNAFYNRSGLISVTIPDSVTSIGYSAFQYCFSLTSVTIGERVTEIGNSAFEYCQNLTGVFCKATTPPSLGDSMFGYYVEDEGYYGELDGRIYVPSISVKTYRKADGWQQYQNQIYGYDF